MATAKDEPSTILNALLKEAEKKVVIIVDEYDSPIIDSYMDKKKADRIRDTLSTFYTVIKNNDDNVRFLYPFCHHRRCYLSIPRDLIDIFEKIYPGLDDIPSVFHADYGEERLEEFLSLYEEIKNSDNSDFFSLMPAVEKYMLSFLSPYLTMGKQTLLRRAKYLLEKEYRMSLPEIASELGLAYNTFRKEFTQAYGISPSQYRIRAKISRSKQLLSMGLSSKEVVGQLGYQDSYTFSHQFKKMTGISPREYKGKNVL